VETCITGRDPIFYWSKYVLTRIVGWTLVTSTVIKSTQQNNRECREPIKLLWNLHPKRYADKMALYLGYNRGWKRQDRIHRRVDHRVADEHPSFRCICPSLWIKAAQSRNCLWGTRSVFTADFRTYFTLETWQGIQSSMAKREATSNMGLVTNFGFNLPPGKQTMTARTSLRAAAVSVTGNLCRNLIS